MPNGTDFQRAIQESDLSMRAGNIDSRNYLLIHGTADTLVHQQHSLILTKALIDQAIGFRHQVCAIDTSPQAFQSICHKNNQF